MELPRDGCEAPKYYLIRNAVEETDIVIGPKRTRSEVFRIYQSGSILENTPTVHLTGLQEQGSDEITCEEKTGTYIRPQVQDKKVLIRADASNRLFRHSQLRLPKTWNVVGVEALGYLQQRCGQLQRVDKIASSFKYADIMLPVTTAD